MAFKEDGIMAHVISEEPRDTVVVDHDHDHDSDHPRSNTGLIIAVVVVILLLLLMFGGSLFGGGGGGTTNVQTQTPAPSSGQ